MRLGNFCLWYMPHILRDTPGKSGRPRWLPALVATLVWLILLAIAHRLLKGHTTGGVCRHDTTDTQEQRTCTSCRLTELADLKEFDVGLSHNLGG